MMIHSIFKLGELCQNFELCRRSYNNFKKCLIDSLRLTAIIAIIAGAFAGINQVLNPKKIEFWDSVTEVYDQSFSLDFVSSSANSTQVRNFLILMRLMQQFILPMVLLNLVFTTLT